MVIFIKPVLINIEFNHKSRKRQVLKVLIANQSFQKNKNQRFLKTVVSLFFKTA
jgi:hypothetical protein